MYNHDGGNMKFKSGMLGTCIIVISLLLGIAGGLLLNVDQTTVNATKYDYVTDITGLFDTSQQAQYIDYSPASNYTGYTNTDPLALYAPTGLDFTSGNANNYRVPVFRSATETGPNGTINNSSNYPQYTFTDYGGGSYAPVDLSERVGGSGYSYVCVRDYKVTYLSNFLTDKFGDLTQYENLTVNFSYPANHAPSEKAFIGTTPREGLPLYGGGTELKHYMFDTITVNGQDGMFAWSYTKGGVTYTGNDNIYSCWLCYGNATQYERSSIAGQPTISNNTSLSLTYTSTFVRASQYAYMLPADGVTLAQVPASNPAQYYTTVWDNDLDYINYDNERIDIIIGPKFNAGNFDYYNSGNLTIGTFDADNNKDQFSFTLAMPGGYAVSQTYQPDGGSSVNVTSKAVKPFNGIMVSFYKDKLEIYGIIDFITYFDITKTPEPLATFYYHYNSTLDHLNISTSSTPLTWSVYNTNVFMNTYDTVLVNPSIDLADYWPDMDYYRYAFQSFAIYGDSMTINGVTYPVTNGQITINYKTYDLTNIYLSFSTEGRASITFKNINRTIDLGETVDKQVSFSGVWYFNSALYEGKQTTEEVYNFDVYGMFENIDIGAFTLLSLGIMAISCLACAVLKVNLGLMDKIIIGFGVVFMLIMLGGYV